MNNNPTQLETLMAEFLREKQFLDNLSPKTIIYFQRTFNVWMKRIGRAELPTTTSTKQLVMALQQTNISIATINSYLRGINSFLSWLYTNSHLPDPLRIKLLKAPAKSLITFSDAQLRVLMGYKPKTFAQRRFYAIAILIIDTGIRIDEALGLTRGNVDWDNLLVKVLGKGSKERVVPISLECRKILYRFTHSHKFDFVFPTSLGERLGYRTCLEQMQSICKGLGITGVRCSPHTLRHSFASAYIRDGGNVFYLQRILGHSDLGTTRIYVHSQTDDLSLLHKRTSLVGKLKRG